MRIEPNTLYILTGLASTLCALFGFSLWWIQKRSKTTAGKITAHRLSGGYCGVF